MFRQRLRRFGVGWMSVALTAISVVVSLLITVLITAAMGSTPGLAGLDPAVSDLDQLDQETDSCEPSRSKSITPAQPSRRVRAGA